MTRVLPVVVAALLVASCATAPKKSTGPAQPGPMGKYYSDDGPPETIPDNLAQIPDAVPREEPFHRFANRPYTVFGHTYVPVVSRDPTKERGLASWYGRMFHGRKTASGEVYDMFAMTAAHKTLPIPSYARVTNVNNGRSVVVRINDRGPFVGERLIDLSYTAAHKLGLVKEGSGLVEVETILPGDLPVQRIAAAAPPAPPPPRDSGPRAAPLEAAPAAPRDAGPRAAPRETAPAGVALAPPEVPAAVNIAPSSATKPAPSAPVAAPPTATPPAVSAPAASTPLTSTVSSAPAASGIYVQFGAFRSRENAETLLARLRQQREWLAARLQIPPREGLYRVHAGPYHNAAEAREIAGRVGDMPGPRPVLLNW